MVLLSVVLEQETELKPVEIMTDTGAYTDAIFGIFYLLGFQFSPRLADARRRAAQDRAGEGIAGGRHRHAQDRQDSRPRHQHGSEA
jgi:hypothetical protein